MSDKKTDQYDDGYRARLEAAYGPHMMSEGGALATERMFEQKSGAISPF